MNFLCQGRRCAYFHCLPHRNDLCLIRVFDFHQTWEDRNCSSWFLKTPPIPALPGFPKAESIFHLRLPSQGSFQPVSIFDFFEGLNCLEYILHFLPSHNYQYRHNDHQYFLLRATRWKTGKVCTKHYPIHHAFNWTQSHFLLTKLTIK